MGCRDLRLDERDVGGTRLTGITVVPRGLFEVQNI